MVDSRLSNPRIQLVWPLACFTHRHTRIHLTKHTIDKQNLSSFFFLYPVLIRGLATCCPSWCASPRGGHAGPLSPTLSVIIHKFHIARRQPTVRHKEPPVRDYTPLLPLSDILFLHLHVLERSATDSNKHSLGYQDVLSLHY